MFSTGRTRSVLSYVDERSTPEFGDHRWRAEGKPGPVSPRDEMITVTKKYLPRGSRVLEGGCGRAIKVKAMATAGYRIVGVDFAEDAVKQARVNYPGLDIRQGDVRSLDFADGYFDGCWFIGVIEHVCSAYIFFAVFVPIGKSFIERARETAAREIANPKYAASSNNVR